jgi:hypothetical protein
MLEVIAMRLKRWCLVGCLVAIVGLLLFSEVQGTAAEPETDATASSQKEFRTWTDRTGTYHADAIFVEFKDGLVTLKKKDGTKVNVSLDHLSDDDRQYVGRFATGTGGEDRNSPGSEPNESSTRGADESVRTDVREEAPSRFRARTAYRTTARTTARTTVESPNNRGSRQVVVDGVGATAEEALKDCFRKAVSVVMGSIVDAETQVENDRLLLDRILTFTDGFVDSFEEVGEAHVEDGLVHRRIVATVGRESLLVACGRTESASVDASGLYPEVMTKLERRRNALALLRKTLDMLPGCLLQVQVGRPPVEKLGDTSTAFGLELVIRVDPQKYEAFQDRMNKILPCLSKQDGTSEAYSSPVAQVSERYRQDLLRKKFLNVAGRIPSDMCVVDVQFADIEDLSITATSNKPQPTGQGGASLFIKGESQWRWFDLDESVDLSPMMETIVVAFRDSAGKEVQTTNLSLGPWVPGFAVPPDTTGGIPRRAFMSPSFLYCSSSGDYGNPKVIAAGSVTVRGGVTLENELLSRVNTIDASVRRTPWVPMEAFHKEPKQSERGLRRTPDNSLTPEEERARRMLIAERAQAARAAASARMRAHAAERDAAFQGMWQGALRRSGL